MKTTSIILLIAGIGTAFALGVGATKYTTKATHPEESTAVATQPTVKAADPDNGATVATQPAVKAADPDDGIAIITSVKPHMVSHKVSTQVCHPEEHVVYSKDPSSIPYAGAALGGVAGGLLGNQLGGGRGREVATIAGALGGVFAGNTVQENMNKPQPHTVGSMKCVNQTKSVQKQKGYEVAYSYQGTEGVRLLQSKPIGTKIAVTTLEAAPELEKK